LEGKQPRRMISKQQIARSRMHGQITPTALLDAHRKFALQIAFCMASHDFALHSSVSRSTAFSPSPLSVCACACFGVIRISVSYNYTVSTRTYDFIVPAQQLWVTPVLLFSQRTVNIRTRSLVSGSKHGRAALVHSLGLGYTHKHRSILFFHGLLCM